MADKQLPDSQGQGASPGRPSQSRLPAEGRDPGPSGSLSQTLTVHSPPGKPAAAAVYDSLLATEVGGCRLLELVGRGGMGAVFRAEQLSLGRIVAVKIIRSLRTDDAELMARFRSEARVVAALDHPNILQIHDVGSQDGLQYIVMEFVDGPNLRQWMLSEQPQSQKTCKLLLTQALTGLGFAHSKGIIHRDIKPDNFLLKDGPIVKIADFGLAKVLHSDQQLTSAGTILGTPKYMSPEAARGEALDQRSDIYSLGATFYHLLTGTPPFVAETPMGVLYRIVNDPLPPISQAKSDIDLELASMVERMLAKEREVRFQNCQEILDLLGVDSGASFLGAQPLAASRGNPTPRETDWGTPTLSRPDRLVRTPIFDAPDPMRPRIVRPKVGRRVWRALLLVLTLLAVILAARQTPAGRKATNKLAKLVLDLRGAIPLPGMSKPIPDPTPKPGTPKKGRSETLDPENALLRARELLEQFQKSTQGTELAKIRSRLEALLSAMDPDRARTLKEKLVHLDLEKMTAGVKALVQRGRYRDALLLVNAFEQRNGQGSWSNTLDRVRRRIDELYLDARLKKRANKFLTALNSHNWKSLLPLIPASLQERANRFGQGASRRGLRLRRRTELLQNIQETLWNVLGLSEEGRLMGCNLERVTVDLDSSTGQTHLLCQIVDDEEADETDWYLAWNYTPELGWTLDPELFP